jgi:hypothetical protein
MARTPSTPGALTLRRERVILGLLLACALLVRGWHIQERRHAPDFDHPIVDAAFHDDWARTLAGRTVERVPTWTTR